MSVVEAKCIVLPHIDDFQVNPSFVSLQFVTVDHNDEKALREALGRVFPGACRMTCTRHAKQNLNALLADKVGLPKRERKKTVDDIFGKDGVLVTEKDNTLISDMLLHIADNCDNEHMTRHIRRLAPMMAENAKALQCPGLQVESALWTNNNCESYNHVLKQATGWKTLKLADLIQQLFTVVEAQYRKI
ncbi:hypothetical protein BaRGS_00032207 [Batillaria attramentaria]|uniref:MULE transposase domain-containing protein n=1 Tax=Batillaria attramentaria TaxID=370345 RepID=A0ABD0JNJ2_9CAEN